MLFNIWIRSGHIIHILRRILVLRLFVKTKRQRVFFNFSPLTASIFGKGLAQFHCHYVFFLLLYNTDIHSLLKDSLEMKYES